MTTQTNPHMPAAPPPRRPSFRPLNDSILVLANFAGAAEATARYAASLGAPLQLPLSLLHLEEPCPLPEPELLAVATRQTQCNEAETQADLRALACRLPGWPKVLETTGTTSEGVAETLRREQPLLLAMGLSREQCLLHRLLFGHVLPVLRATGRPLLLVPKDGACVGPPRRVLVAVDDEPFTPNAASRALAPLLAAWGATFMVAHVSARTEQQGAPGRLALTDLRASNLLADSAPLALYEVADADPATGLLRAVADTQADLLILISRPHNFWGKAFHRGVTAAVLRYCNVPVLLLPAEPLD